MIEAPQAVSAAPARGRPGVILKLMGAVLMMLGTLDSLLTLRGGVPAYEFLLLIVLGAAVFAVGAVRASYGAGDHGAAQPDQAGTGPMEDGN